MTSYLSRVVRFAISYRQWVAAGKPRRHPDRVKELYSICLACDRFGDDWCKECGCRVNDDADKDLNKLAWPTEECPLKKWGKEIQ